MEYTPTILDLSTRRDTLPDLMLIEPRFTVLESEPSSSNLSVSPVEKHYPDFSDSDSIPSTSTNLKQSRSLKLPRPFKAYPKDPLNLGVSVATAETILGQESYEAYAKFRNRMLSQVQSLTTTTNKNMRRYSQTPYTANNDPSYWEKRRKNNEAAKRSRDARRAKEDEIAIRCAFLEQENLKLRYETATLKEELDRLRKLIYK